MYCLGTGNNKVNRTNRASIPVCSMPISASMDSVNFTLILCHTSDIAETKTMVYFPRISSLPEGETNKWWEDTGKGFNTVRRCQVTKVSVAFLKEATPVLHQEGWLDAGHSDEKKRVKVRQRWGQEEVFISLSTLTLKKADKRLVGKLCCCCFSFSLSSLFLPFCFLETSVAEVIPIWGSENESLSNDRKGGNEDSLGQRKTSEEKNFSVLISIQYMISSRIENLGDWVGH